MTYASPGSRAAVDLRFTLDTVQTWTRDELSEAACAFAHRINESVPDGRYKSLAQTAVEEALLWALRGTMDEEL